MKPFPSTVEILEARIAPASLTFIDVDGDTVKITTSKGSDAALEAAATLVPSGGGKILQKLALGSDFKGTNVTIEVTSTGDTDEAVNVGWIDATGFDLGKVIVDGDLGQIDAGDAKLSTPAIKLLQAASLSKVAGTQDSGTASRISSFNGSVTKIDIAGDFAGQVVVGGGSSANLGTLKIGGALQPGDATERAGVDVDGAITSIEVIGNLNGGALPASGTISADGNIKTAKIGGLVGGTGLNSGALISGRTISSLTISGSITGNVAGDGIHNAAVLADKIGTVVIKGVIQGGNAALSGVLDANRGLSSITVEGGIFGGAGDESGAVLTGASLAKVVLGKSTDLAGARLQGGGGLRSGSLLSGGGIVSVESFGDVRGGEGEQSGGISAVTTIEKVTVHGELRGGSGPNSGTIGAGGAIKKVTLEGGLQGGDGDFSGRVVSVASLGTVSVGDHFFGGVGMQSGTVGAPGNNTSIIVDGDLRGGTGPLSGAILTGDTLSSLVITGSIIGGDGDGSGHVEADTFTKVSITGDVQGGLGPNSGSLVYRVRAKSIDIDGSLSGSQEPDSTQGFSNGLISGIGSLDSLHIGGDLQGGVASSSGTVHATGPIGTVVIDGSLVGGNGDNSGVIQTNTQIDGGTPPRIGSVLIKQALLGGNGNFSGAISGGDIGSVTIAGTTPRPTTDGDVSGNLQGGAGTLSGYIFSSTEIGTVSVAKSVIGGRGHDSGQIASRGEINRVTIGAELVGSAVDFTAILGVGQIHANGTIGSVDIEGNIRGDSGEYSAAIIGGSIGSVHVGADVITGLGQRSAAIMAQSHDIGTVTVDGAMRQGQIQGQVQPQGPFVFAAERIGSVTAGSIVGSSGNVAEIIAVGLANPKTVKESVAIGSVRVLNHMAYTQILAGLNANLQLVNSAVRIGTVDVGPTKGLIPGNVWQSNDVIAGFAPADANIFGTGDDQGGLTSEIHSQIAKVIIRGPVSDSGPKHAIEAREVVSVIVNGNALGLTSGPANDNGVPVSPLEFTVANEAVTLRL